MLTHSLTIALRCKWIEMSDDFVLKACAMLRSLTPVIPSTVCNLQFLYQNAWYR